MTAVVLSLVLIQDAHRLEVQSEAGDTYKTVRSEKFDGRSKLVDDKQAVQDDSILSREDIVSKDEVLEAESGKAKKLSRKIEKCVFESKLFGSDKTEKGKRGLDGKMILLVRDGKDTKISGADDVPADELAKIKFKADPFVESLPKEEVKPGAKWSIDEAALKDFFTVAGEGLTFTKVSGNCTFEKIEDHAGFKCAAIKIVVKLEATGENSMKLQTELKGTYWIAVAEKRYTGLELEGKYGTQATNPDDQLTMESSGKISISETITYEKVGSQSSTPKDKK